MIKKSDAEYLADFLKSVIHEDEYELILDDGYYNLVFGNDEASIKAKQIICSKPVNEKIDFLNDCLSSMVGSDVNVNICGFDEKYVRISEIGSKHIGNIIKVKAVINGVSNIKPVCELLRMKCRKCESEVDIEQHDPFVLRTLSKCCAPNEKSQPCNGLLEIQHEMSEYKDSQNLTIQELPEDINKQIPTIKDVIVYNNSLLDKFKSGDQVDIIGIVKIKFNTSPHNNRRTESYIEALNIIPKRKDITTMSLTNEEMADVINLSKTENIYQRLIDNIAPSIYGFNKEKEAGLLSLVGGVEKEYIDETGGRYWINVFLIGDPATAKSRLLQAIYKLAPIGIFTGGRGVSGVGLTSAIIHEKGSDAPMLVAGALPLADKGIACVDELDKIKPDDVNAMYIAMENGVVPVTKGGFNTSLMSRTAIFGAANPALGRYDFNRNVSENLKGFPVVLLSRFDLIFICLDEANEETDYKIAHKVMNKEIPEDDNKVKLIDRQLLKNYIFYAKSLKPQLKDGLEKFIANYYCNLRKRQSREDPVPITARNLGAIIRLAEAHAKVLLKDVVDEDDAKAAIKLLNASLEQTCKIVDTDGVTKINVDKINAPLNQMDRETLVIKVLSENKSGGMTIDEISKATNGRVSVDEVRKIVSRNFNKIYEPISGIYRTY